MYNNYIKKFFKATLLFTVLFTIFACSNAVNGTNDGGRNETPVSLSLTFNANDGSESPATSTQSIPKGKSTQLTLVEFSRDGFVFTGWATTPDGEVVYSDGQVINITEDTVLYAVWLSKENIYVITFNAAYDGYKGPKIIQCVPKGESDSTDVKLRANTIDRINYKFSKWTTSDGSKKYDDGSVITVTKDINLYAEWEKINTSGAVDGVIVVFHKNDGSNETVTKTNLQLLSGSYYSDTFTRPGYTFRGWADAADSYVPINAYVFINSGTYDFYAVWQNNSKYKVIYSSSMFGSWGSLSSGDISLVESGSTPYQEFNVVNGKATATFIDCPITKEGYKFSCWSSGLDELYAGQSSEISSDTVVFPVWVSDANACKITMHMNDGSDTEDIIRYVEKTEYIDAFLPKNVPFSREGYTFDGWNTSADESGTYYGTSLFDRISSDVEVYAIWRKNPVVHFHPNYEGATEESYSQNFIWGEGQNLLPNTFTREGYIFTGWHEDPSSTYVYRNDGGYFSSSSTTKSEYNFYAVWKLPRTITFNANDGSENPATVTQIVPANTSIYLNKNTFSKEGYIFAGWATSPTAKSVDYEDYAWESFPRDITLYAVWKDNVKITYRPNFTGAEPSFTEQVVVYNEKITLDAVPWTREGYTIYGWDTYPNVTSPDYKYMQETQFKEDKTLYAIWKEDVTLTFNKNDGSESPETFTEKAGYNKEYEHPECPWTRDGYTFIGWSTWAKETNSNNCYQTSTNTSSHTWYAIWTKDHPVLTLHSNDENDSSDTQTFDYNVEAAIKENPFTPVTGKYFKGWDTSSTSTYTRYNDCGKIKITADTDLYAIWGDSAKITYNANDGTDNPATKVQYYGNNLVTLEPNTFTRDGYIFVGWANFATSTYVTYKDGETVSYPSSNLYALWIEDKGNCTVTFKININGRTESFTETYPIGLKQLLPECPWTSEGNCFMAWDVNQHISYGNKAENQSKTFEGDTVLYAVWKKAPLVIFHKNDGSNETKTQYVVYGTDTKLDPNEFTVEGKRFIGWSSYPDSTYAWYEDCEEVKLTSNKDLYAIWKGQPKVILNANDGSENPEEITLDFVEDESQNLPANTFTREGYTFYGWGLTPASVEKTVSDKGSYETSDDVTLYAIWRQN